MATEKLYCPDFVYDICVGLTVHEFLTRELSLSMVSKKFSMAVSDHYFEIVEEEMSSPAEEILRFMSEQKNPKYEAHEKANFFVYNRLKFDGLKGQRKLKGMFSNPFKGDKERKYNAEKTIKSFKAVVFAVRAGAIEKVPPGWSIKKEPDLEDSELKKIVNKEVPIDDLI